MPGPQRKILPASQKDLIASLTGNVLIYYDGYCLGCPDQLIGRILNTLKCDPCPMSSDDIKKQMDTFCEALKKAYDENADLQNPETFKKYFPEIPSFQHLSIVWISNVQTLLLRNVIKNDNMNGYLGFKTKKLS